MEAEELERNRKEDLEGGKGGRIDIGVEGQSLGLVLDSHLRIVA